MHNAHTYLNLLNWVCIERCIVIRENLFDIILPIMCDFTGFLVHLCDFTSVFSFSKYYFGFLQVRRQYHHHLPELAISLEPSVKKSSLPTVQKIRV